MVTRLRASLSGESFGKDRTELMAEVVLLVLIGIVEDSGTDYSWGGSGITGMTGAILWIGSGHASTNLLENYAYGAGTAWLFDILNDSVGTNLSLCALRCLGSAHRYGVGLLANHTPPVGCLYYAGIRVIGFLPGLSRIHRAINPTDISQLSYMYDAICAFAALDARGFLYGAQRFSMRAIC